MNKPMRRINQEGLKILKRLEYVIVETKRFVITRKYGKGCGIQYFRRIGELLRDLFLSALNILVFPLRLIYTLLSFLPHVYLKESGNEKGAE